MAAPLIETFPVGPLQCNCSIVVDEASREAVVIDPGDEPERILKALGAAKVTPVALLHTHAHFDHVTGTREVAQATKAPIEAGERIPAFYLHDETADFGYLRWEIFTPRSRRKLFQSEYRRPDNQEWAVQLNLSSPEKVWASPERKERHDVDTVVAVHP